jgi:hypothetical protein
VRAEERGVVHTTSSLRALSYRFAVCTDDAVLGRHVDDLFAGLRDPGPIEHRYTLSSATSGSAPGTVPGLGTGLVDVRRDGLLIAEGQRPPDAVGWLLWDVNRAAAESSGEHLLFHAGAVQVADGGVLLSAPSGSGKSTLCAALARGGLPYLSDELVAIDLDTGWLLPYPKPITLKPGPGIAALCELDPAISDTLSDDRRDAGEEWHVPVGDGGVGRIGGPCAPGFVVLPRYQPGAPTTLTTLTETQTFMQLATNIVNFKELGDAAIAALGALVARCECAALTMSDLREACRLVLDFVGAPVPEVERAR